MEVHLTIEALIVNGADRRPYLLPNIDRRLLAIDLAANLQHGPTGLGLATWAVGPSGRLGTGLLAEPPRDYEADRQEEHLPRPGAQGRGPSQDERHARMDGAALRPPDRHHHRRRTAGRCRAGFTTFPATRGFACGQRPGYEFSFIKDGNKKSVLRGAVVRIDERDVIYRAEVTAPDEPPRDDILGDGFFRLSKKDRDGLVADHVVRSDEAANVFRDRAELLGRAGEAESDPRERKGCLQNSTGTGWLGPAGTSGRAGGGGRRSLGRGRGRCGRRRRPAGRIPGFGGFGGFGGGRGAAPAVEVLTGSIVQSDAAELLVLIEPRYYGVHIGQSMEDSLKKPLKRDQIKELKLVAN